ncbi:MAG: flagellar motor protein MotD [Rhodanobacter sp.]
MRKKQHEEHINHEAWAIPYADLMTLLLAFFVVMYAVSVVNEGKYRVASASMVEAFNGSSRPLLPPAPAPATAPVPVTTHPTSAASAPLAPASASLPRRRKPSPPAATPARTAANLQRIEDQVRKALQPLINRQMVELRRGPDTLEIEIRTDVLFPSGVARLSIPADTVLRNMAAILAPFGNPLRVEGFTDNVPIATSMYPSNWELSAARAATVVRLFAEHGVSADRLSIVGWGEARAIGDNATIEGRNRNRRVLVVVMGEADSPERPAQDVDQLRLGAQMTAVRVPPAPHADAGPEPTATPDTVASAASAPALEQAPVRMLPVPGVTAVSTVRWTAAPAPGGDYLRADPLVR